MLGALYVYTEGMRASDRAYRQLREEITSGHLEPEAVLMEVEQSERLGVSRTPVREALNRLHADGLVQPHRGRGMVVTPISMHVADEIFDVRLAAEPLAVRRAAENVESKTPDDDALAQAFDELAARFRHAEHSWQQDASTRPDDYYRLTGQLDDAVDEACGNPYLVQTLGSLRIHLTRLRRLSQHDQQRLADSAGEHARVAEAIAAGDPDLAEAASRLHLQQALTHLRLRIHETSETTGKTPDH